VGDVDGDGRMDLIAFNRYRWGEGPLTFVAPVTNIVTQ
jgi:hypothetical protein